MNMYELYIQLNIMEILKKLPFDLQEHILVKVMKQYIATMIHNRFAISLTLKIYTIVL